MDNHGYERYKTTKAANEAVKKINKMEKEIIKIDNAIQKSLIKIDSMKKEIKKYKDDIAEFMKY